jgi:LmbE family N-acetylglucosaminyl deacetylase
MTGVTSTPPSPTGELPRWSSVLAVVAHPDDESFGLGAVLDGFARAGAEVSVLCLTHGEASTIHGVSGDLAELRAMELQAAAAELGATRTALRSHRDGDLRSDHVPVVGEIIHEASEVSAEGLVVFDSTGITGHPDHIAATSAALEAAARLHLPVLAWTIPTTVAERLNDEFDAALTGQPFAAIDVHLPVTRDRQRRASLAHASQAVPTSVLWRRLELLGDVEYLRWLRRPASADRPQPTPSS